MKNYTVEALDVMQCIANDATAACPDVRDSLVKDLSYLRRAIEHRGLPFITITLPAYGKHLDRCFDVGILTTQGLPQGIPTSRSKPLLFAGLLNRVFGNDHRLRPNACSSAVFFLRQLCYFLKKFRLECQPQYVEAAIADFFQIEERLPRAIKDTWDDQVPHWTPICNPDPMGRDEEKGSRDALLFECLDPTHDIIDWSDFHDICRRISSSLGYLDPWSIRPKHGPGVVSENLKGTSKYDFPNWPSKLENYFPFDWHGSGLLDKPELMPDDREESSRLIAVPKTQKGPRLICAEPVAHQWIQQGIWRWLEEAVGTSVLRHCIDFRSQEQSRSDALHSSLSGDRVTIDLSSASDRLSSRLVHYVLQGNISLLDALHACRSRSLKQTLSKDHPKMILLRKFAPMGSAVTFPIQSIVFATIAITAVIRSCDEASLSIDEAARRVRVFGDDIIVPKYAYEDTIRLLAGCGLKVNVDKTFSGSNFRESCGMDAFRGIDVTPAYVLEMYDGSPSSLSAIVESSNNFHNKGCWATAQYLAGQLPVSERKLLPIVGQGDGTFGLASFTGGSFSHLSQVWDKDYQYWLPKRLILSSRASKTRSKGHGDVSQYFFEKPSAHDEWAAGTVTGSSVRKQKTGPSRKR